MRLPAGVSSAVCTGVLLSSTAFADRAVLNTRLMTLGIASKIARVAVASCADAGYQVSAVAVDRSGAPQVLMRDVFASRFTIDIAERKANGILVLDGAVPIRAVRCSGRSV